MINPYRLGLMASVALPVAFALAPSAAFAQTSSVPPQSAGGAAAAPAPQSDQSSPSVLGEIVVTATRHSESQQKVPISIAAYTAETLKAQSITATADLPQLTPGLSYTRVLAGSNAYLRGVGSISPGYTAESQIATYIDGLYLPNSAAAAFSFNNIARIEVLKGPQGTLYGRNSTGGLINVITKDPGATPSLDVSAGYANYDTASLNVYGSTPLGENLAINVAGTYTDQSDGWGRNLLLDKEAFTFKDVGAQAKLKWTPSERTTVTLRGFYDRTRSDEGNSLSIFPGSVGLDGTPYLGKYRINTRRAPKVVQRQTAVSLKAEQKFDFATLTSTTGYVDNSSPSQNIPNGIAGNPIVGQSAVNIDVLASSKVFSQEFQLASNPSDSPLSWVAGLYYYHANNMNRFGVYGTCVGSTCAAAPLPTQTTGFTRTRSYSAYADGTYSVTPATRLTVGLRYTVDKQSLSGFAIPLAGLPNSPAALPPSVVLHPGDPFPGFPNGIDTAVSYPKLTFRGVLAQDLTPDIHAYASFNRGFKSGEYNPVSFTNPATKPEVLDAYELGIKSELFGHILRLNASAFYYDYHNIQLKSTAPPAPPGQALFFNAASAHSKGLDADFVFAPAQGLTFNGGLELLDATYTSFPNGQCTFPRAIAGPVLGGVGSTPCDLAGKRLPNAPKFSYRLGVTYTFETSMGSFALNANDGYKSSYFWETDNRLTQRAYHLVNTSATWTSEDGRYSLQVFAKNLTNTYYFAGAQEGSFGNDVYVPGAPRTYGVIAGYHF
jgi:iron complex outermembrane receptor protein